MLELCRRLCESQSKFLDLFCHQQEEEEEEEEETDDSDESIDSLSDDDAIEGNTLQRIIQRMLSRS